MKSTITIEIELPVDYSATKGYPATHTDPACPDEVEAISFNHGDAIKLIEGYIEDNTAEIEEALLCDANQAAIEYEYDKAESLYWNKEE